jgi:hypothetical protein
MRHLLSHFDRETRDELLDSIARRVFGHGPYFPPNTPIRDPAGFALARAASVAPMPGQQQRISRIVAKARHRNPSGVTRGSQGAW